MRWPVCHDAWERLQHHHRDADVGVKQQWHALLVLVLIPPCGRGAQAWGGIGQKSIHCWVHFTGLRKMLCCQNSVGGSSEDTSEEESVRTSDCPSPEI